MHRLRQFLSFYSRAATLYQVHSPFVFNLTREVLEDRRSYYAFDAVEGLRRELLRSGETVLHTDWGTGGGAAPGQARRTTVGRLVRRAASSPEQGRRLFRLAQALEAGRILEIGTSLGIGALYLASACRGGRMIGLEGCPDCAERARRHALRLDLPHLEVRDGEFDQTLLPALRELRPDLVFLDGNHRREATERYFLACLPFAHDRTAFVFDDVHASAGMSAAWRAVQDHPRVTLTIDWFGLSVAFINPVFIKKQHFRLLPFRWKPWKAFL
jgi:predicted O-methyltransferase YrrM